MALTQADLISVKDTSSTGFCCRWHMSWLVEYLSLKMRLSVREHSVASSDILSLTMTVRRSRLNFLFLYTRHSRPLLATLLFVSTVKVTSGQVTFISVEHSGVKADLVLPTMKNYINFRSPTNVNCLKGTHK